MFISKDRVVPHSLLSGWGPWQAAGLEKSCGLRNICRARQGGGPGCSSTCFLNNIYGKFEATSKTPKFVRSQKRRSCITASKCGTWRRYLQGFVFGMCCTHRETKLVDCQAKSFKATVFKASDQRWSVVVGENLSSTSGRCWYEQLVIWQYGMDEMRASPVDLQISYWCTFGKKL